MPEPDLSRLKLVTLEVAADLLGVSRRTLQRLIASSEFPKPIKVGAASRVLVEDIERYIQRQRGTK